MANQHHTTIKLIDGFCQCIDGLDIQVIGGLIKEQHVRVLPGQPGKTHPAFLTIRQVPNRTDLENISDVKLETFVDQDKKTPQILVLPYLKKHPDLTCCFPVSP